ncbi:unnamed protein product [Nippostrongylus brasiliensis]|uniref:SSD domain-containing protein n=1 Tax=Nippostrongylus brasiliensis TaxID=27835 RepID=A0A3P7AI93_NIPBR|nr:unnamed protein product [Nippostrongylus brasiliensis]
MGPPPSVPDDHSASQSNTLNRTTGTLSTLKRERARERERQQRELNILGDAQRRDDAAESKTSDRPDSNNRHHVTSPVSIGHTSLKEKTSYVEEPHSNATTLERKERKLEKEQALVRRITNDMQIAHYVRQMEMAHSHGKRHRGAFSTGVYRIRSLRFVEAGLRRALWYLGKAIANHKLLFVMLPLLLISASLVGPILHRQKMTVSMPFTVMGGFGNDVISNGYSIQRTQREFNYSNPAFTALNFLDLVARDTILRKDAVLAYSALKKRLDNFPVGNREFLESCPAECELEKEMVDKIIKKSPQVSLTYPETFVSMSKDSTNLSRVYLGSAIGGVETDSDGAISRAQALMLSFKLKESVTVEQNAAWAENFIEQVHITSAPNVSLSFWSPSSFSSWVIRALSKSYKWLLVSVGIMSLFCFLATFGANAYQIAFTLVVSCAGGLFVQVASSAHFDPLIWPVSNQKFSGIGLLWLFCLHQSWSRYSSAAVHPTEKLAFILAHDGPGLTASAIIVVVTTCELISCIFQNLQLEYPFSAPTLMLGAAVAPQRHMETTMVTMSAAVAILFIFLVMFISVFIYIGGRREAKGVKWYQCFTTGDTHFTAPNLSDFDSSSLFSLHDRLIDARPSVARALGDRLIARNSRYPIVIVCTIVLIFAIWGCVNMRIDMREEHFLPSASPSRSFLEEYREMFGKTTQFLEVSLFTCSLRLWSIVIEDPVEYEEDVVRDSILEMMDSTVDTFVPVVNLVFLEADPYKRFASDISFDRHQTQITRSRMYLELTQKGVDERVSLVQSLMSKSRELHLPLSALSSGLFVFGISLVCLFLLSLLLLGQPALTFVLVFTSVAVLVETIGYSTHWGVPMNVITLTMAISANMLTTVIVIAFCYSYSVSGKQQMRAGIRIQYSFQATFLPVVFATLVPVITYLPLFAVDAPLISHIWKVLLVNSVATLLHYLFFLPNLCLLFSTHLPTCTSFNCTECCCDFEDDSSIYYIPTTARAVHPEGVYQHTSYTYSVPQSIVNGGPPNYLAIAGPPPVPSYAGEYVHTHVNRTRSKRTRRVSDRVTSVSTSPQGGRHSHGPYFQDPTLNVHQQRWRPFVHPQPYIYPYPSNGFRR